MIILAAGRSTRMGNANKLGLPLGDKSVLDWTIEAALSSKADQTIVVSNDEQIAGRHNRVTYIPAALAHLGQSHSLAAGISHIHQNPQATGALIALGDMPFLTADHINRVLQYGRAEPNTIWRPVHEGCPGHPVYWPKRYFSALEALEGDQGAKSILANAVEGDVKEIAFTDDGVVFDVDTPERFTIAKARLIARL